MTAIAGVDVGGSGIRAVIRGSEREVRGAVDRPVHVHSSLKPDDVADGIVRLLAEVGDGSSDPLGVLCIGMTGYPGLLDDPEQIARRVMARANARAVLVASDALTTHVGALGMRSGVVVAAGTGVIALGTDHSTTWNRADGWGHLLGDDGSGAWIGRAGISAGLRARDGRDAGSVALWNGIRERFGDVPALLATIYESASPAYELARFAPLVADVARDGDAIAARIWREAAGHLANSAVAASAGVDPLFSWGGGLFSSDDLLLGPFQELAAEQLPTARFHVPVGGALDGALLLAERHANAPIGDLGGYAHAYERCARRRHVVRV